MKKIITLSLLFLFTLQFVNAQEKPKKTPKHKTVLSLGITASPDIYIYDFKASSNLKFDYRSEFNYSAGIAAVYYPVKFISLRFAALYSTKGFSLDYNYKVEPPSVNPDSVKTKTTLVADYLDIPVILHLNIIHKDRVQLFISGGLVPGVLMKKAQETIFKSNAERQTNDMSKNFSDFLAGTIYSIGFKYNLSEKFGIGLDPYFRYYLNKIDKSSMSANPVSFGGKVAFYINFTHKHHRGNWGK